MSTPELITDTHKPTGTKLVTVRKPSKRAGNRVEELERLAEIADLKALDIDMDPVTNVTRTRKLRRLRQQWKAEDAGKKDQDADEDGKAPVSPYPDVRIAMFSAVAVQLSLEGGTVIERTGGDGACGGDAAPLVAAYEDLDIDIGDWVDQTVATVWRNARLTSAEKNSPGGSPGASQPPTPKEPPSPSPATPSSPNQRA